MRVEELALSDPGQDGPPWLWVDLRDDTYSGHVDLRTGDQMRQKCARTLLGLQRKFCQSGDPIHALTAMTWCQLYRVMLPPWVESTVAQLAWSAIMAPTVIRGRRLRQTHWIRFAAVNDHLRKQQAAGRKRPNKKLAYDDVSAALRGQLAQASPPRIEASYRKVLNAIRRGEVNRFALGALDNRYAADVFGNMRKRAPRM
jgi:hypothetical protein